MSSSSEENSSSSESESVHPEENKNKEEMKSNTEKADVVITISNGDKRDEENHPETTSRKNTMEMQDLPNTLTPELWKKMKEKALNPIQLYCDIKSFKVKNPKKVAKKTGEAHKTILSDIRASFEPGSLTAIMGSSGAGKTTLLNVLAGRTSGIIDGEILLNGRTRSEAKDLTSLQAYVMQDDIMMKTQTPQEILQFSADLRISNQTSKVEKKKLVENLIDELNIITCKDTHVGAAGEKRGISGGERKRVAIGVELVTNPSLLFLDEPTSGLDSYTAENVINTLQQLARAGRTVVCTIHQPNSQIFHMFDNLMLLARGKIVYHGPASGAVKYFSSIGYNIPAYTNPSDYFMSLMHIEQSNPESVARVEGMQKAWSNSKDKQSLQEKIVIYKKKTEQKKQNHIGYQQSFFFQVALLMKRNFSDFFREPLKLRAGIGQNVFLGVLLGLIYLNLGNEQSTVQDRTGALFFIITNQAMGSIVSIVNIFPSEKAIFFREHNNNMYSTKSYYIAKVVADLPFQIFYPFLFGTISYWMIGFQREATKYLIYLGVLILIANVGAGVGLLLSTIAPNSSVAIALVPVTIIPFMLFSGFLVNSNNVPDYFIWVEYLSFVKWAFQALALNEFQGLALSCKEAQKINGVCPIPNGEAVLSSFGFEDSKIWVSTVILVAMFVFFRIAAFLALYAKANSKKSAEV